MQNNINIYSNIYQLITGRMTIVTLTPGSLISI